MKALAFLYGGSLSPEAFEKVFPGGKSAFGLALERARLFPGWQKTVVLGREDLAGEELPGGTELALEPRWTRELMLETISRLSQGYDLSYVAWADTPFLDPELAAALAERHLRYAAEYSYADGWPYGFAPELLSPGAAGVLAKIAGTGESRRESLVERDSIFAVLQKDINSFDIETEIAREDLRSYRLCLAADSKRNLLLLTRFSAASGTGIPAAGEAGEIIEKKPEILRTLPSFYPIQAARSCPQSCAFCPYPALREAAGGAPSGPGVLGAGEFLDPARFGALLEAIVSFSGDAVIDLSLWGELALHPRRLELIRLVLERPGPGRSRRPGRGGLLRGPFTGAASARPPAAGGASAPVLDRFAGYRGPSAVPGNPGAGLRGGFGMRQKAVRPFSGGYLRPGR
jgi:spiro-SPASM protein